jgi:hypothetical protein
LFHFLPPLSRSHNQFIDCEKAYNVTMQQPETEVLDLCEAVHRMCDDGVIVAVVDVAAVVAGAGASVVALGGIVDDFGGFDFGAAVVVAVVVVPADAFVAVAVVGVVVVAGLVGVAGVVAVVVPGGVVAAGGVAIAIVVAHGVVVAAGCCCYSRAKVAWSALPPARPSAPTAAERAPHPSKREGASR